MDVDMAFVTEWLAQAIPPDGRGDWQTAMFIGYQAINGMLVLEDGTAHFELSLRAYKEWFHLTWFLNEFAQLRQLDETLGEAFPGEHLVLWLEGSPQTGDFRAIYREDGTVLLPNGQQRTVFRGGEEGKVGQLIWDWPGHVHWPGSAQGDTALFERPHSNPGEGMCPVERGFGICAQGLDIRCAQSLTAKTIFGDETLRLRRMVTERKLYRQARFNWPPDDETWARFHQIGAGKRLDEMQRQMAQEEVRLEQALLQPVVEESEAE